MKENRPGRSRARRTLVRNGFAGVMLASLAATTACGSESRDFSKACIVIDNKATGCSSGSKDYSTNEADYKYAITVGVDNSGGSVDSTTVIYSKEQPKVTVLPDGSKSVRATNVFCGGVSITDEKVGCNEEHLNSWEFKTKNTVSISQK